MSPSGHGPPRLRGGSYSILHVIGLGGFRSVHTVSGLMGSETRGRPLSVQSGSPARGCREHGPGRQGPGCPGEWQPLSCPSP